MREKIRGLIIWLVIVLIVGVTCILIGYKIGHKNQDKRTDAPVEEKKEQEVPTQEETEERTDEELVKPFLAAIQICDPEGTYYLKDTTKYEDLSGSKAIEIALLNHTHDEWERILKEEEVVHEFDPENPIPEDEFDDIETSYIKEQIAYTFGKDKKIKFPKELDFWDETYKLEGDKYVISAQGGGCTLFTDYIETKVIKGTKNNDEYVIQVNFVYVTYDEKVTAGTENEDDTPVIVYNNLNKKRVVAKDFTYGDQEKQLDKILDSDKTDYMLFTFKTEDNHYIFDKVEVIKR